MMDFGLLIIRLIIGITFMGHGAQKIIWLVRRLRFKRNRWSDGVNRFTSWCIYGIYGGATELLGGFLFASGIFIVVGSLFIVGTMLMAIFTVHGKMVTG